jgi:hypothetical protein
MGAWVRLLVTISLVSLCVIGSSVPARAQYDSIGPAIAAAIGELIDQDLSMPSLGGPTGIVSMPNAVTMTAGEWQTALSYQGMRPSASGMYQAPDDLSAWTLQATLGLDDTAEAWAAYSSTADHEGSRVWGLGAKKMLAHPREEAPVVAVGASYHRWGDAFAAGSLGDGAARPNANVTKAYAVVTGPLGDDDWPFGLLGTGGIMYIGVDPDRGRSQSLARPFVALQAIVWGTGLGLEYRWKDASVDAKPVFSAAIRQVLSSEVTAELGTTNASPVGTGLSAQRLFLRVSRCL